MLLDVDCDGEAVGLGGIMLHFLKVVRLWGRLKRVPQSHLPLNAAVRRPINGDDRFSGISGRNFNPPAVTVDNSPAFGETEA